MTTLRPAGPLHLALSLIVLTTLSTGCEPDVRSEMDLDETGDADGGSEDGQTDGTDGTGTDGEPVEYCEFADPALERAVADDLGIALGTGVPVHQAEQLQALSRAADGIGSLEGIECAANLRSIELPDNTLTDLSPLAGLPLEILDLSGNAISDLGPLDGMDSLPTLRVSATGTTRPGRAPSMGLGLNPTAVPVSRSGRVRTRSPKGRALSARATSG